MLGQQFSEYVVVFRGNLNNFWLDILSDIISDIQLEQMGEGFTRMYVSLTVDTKLYLLKTLALLDKPIIFLEEV